jgi:type IV pilus assembly protein PilO
MNLREPRTQRIILVSILGLGLLYCYFFTTYVPFTYKARAAETAKVEAELAKLSGDVAKARAAVANLPALERECAEVHERWEIMAELLPTSKEIAALLTKVTLAGQESGIEFALFQPASPRQGDFYVTYPTQLRVEGGYHEVGRFLAEVANLDRIVNIVDLNMTAAQGDEKDPERTVVAAFTAEAYAFQENAPKPAAEPEQAKGKKK